MMQGIYYKEWSNLLGRDMEFKVYGHAGIPVLALPARCGRFYDWENNNMPDAVSSLLNEGKLQLFCADSVDGEGLLNTSLSQRRRAELQEKYFLYLTTELAPRILALNGGKTLWCAGVDLGAYHAVNCRLRRPELFAGAICMDGIYELARFWGDAAADDLALRNAPLLAVHKTGLYDHAALKAANQNTLMLCAGQGAYQQDTLADTHAMEKGLAETGIPAHTEFWGNDVSHDWYWWSKMWNLFASRIV